MLYAIVGTVVLILDQLLKLWVNKNLPVDTGIRPLIPGVIHLTNIHNEGAAFGLFAGARILLLLVLILFTVAAIFLLWKGIVRKPLGRWSLVLLLVGALGNGIDRAIFGYVVDMFEFELFTFAIFNISDCLITVCGVIFLVHVLLSKIRGEEDEEEEMEAPRPKRKAPPQKRERETVAAAAAPQRRSAPAQRPAAPAQRPAAPAQRPAAPAQRPAAPAQRSAAPTQRSTPTAARPAASAARPTAPAARPTAPAARPTAPAARPAAPAAPAARPAAPVQRPAAPAPVQSASAPVQRPAAPAVEKSVQPVAAPAADSFDLDAILAEFK